MPSITLLESAKLSQNQFVPKIVENVVTVDKFYNILPFQGIEGNALQYQREDALGDVQTLAVGGTITAKAAASFTTVTTNLTTIVGDATINGLIQATRSNYIDQAEAQVMSKAKSIGRKYADMLINGDKDGDATQFDGLLSLLPVGQSVSAGDNGAALSFGLLDEAMDLVKDKDGAIDYIIMNSRELRALNVLYRAQGGAGIIETATLPGNTVVPAYRGVPIFRNDWIPVNQTKGNASNASTILMGTLDDGSSTVGITGLHARNNTGISMSYIGELEDADESLYRIKFYSGLALFSNLGIAGITGIIPAT
jgi:hypothetical protein